VTDHDRQSTWDLLTEPLRHGEPSPEADSELRRRGWRPAAVALVRLVISPGAHDVWDLDAGNVALDADRRCSCSKTGTVRCPKCGPRCAPSSHTDGSAR
jgi:hypothetical protein